MKRLMIFVIMLCSSTIAMAQMDGSVQIAKPSNQTDGYFSIAFDTKASTGLGKQNSSYALNEVGIQYGYHFNDRWSIHLPIYASTSLFNQTKTFTQQWYAGIGGEYKFLKTRLSDLSVIARVQSTIGKNSWGVMSYELGIKDQWKENIHFSIGLKYMDTYKSPIPASPISNKITLFMSVGFTFNAPK